MRNAEDRAQFAQRLNDALDELGVPRKGKGRQQQLARMFDVTQGSARKWLEGESYPEMQRIPEFARKLQVRPDWLLTGAGEMKQEAPAGLLDEALLRDCINTVDTAAQTLRSDISASQRAGIVARVYKRAMTSGKPDASLARDLVDLVSQS